MAYCGVELDGFFRAFPCGSVAKLFFLIEVPRYFLATGIKKSPPRMEGWERSYCFG